VTDTKELSVGPKTSSIEFPNGAAITKTPLYHSTDDDGTTAFSFDTGDFSNAHDEYVVWGHVQGNDSGSANYKPLEITFNNITAADYSYTYESGGTLTEVTGGSAWQDGIFSTWQGYFKYRISGILGNGEEPFIVAESTSHRRANVLQRGVYEGVLGSRISSFQLSTGFEATGVMTVIGVDF